MIRVEVLDICPPNMIITIIVIIIVSQPLASPCTGQFRSPLLLFTPDIICISRGKGVETTSAKLPDYLIFKLNEQQIIANDVPPSWNIFPHLRSSAFSVSSKQSWNAVISWTVSFLFLLPRREVTLSLFPSLSYSVWRTLYIERIRKCSLITHVERIIHV